MIFTLLSSGFRLSGTRDRRLIRGLYYAVIEGFFAALIYFVLYFLLIKVFSGTLTVSFALLLGGGMLVCLILRIVTSTIGIPMVFSGAYAMMGEARLRLADHLRKLPMGWFGRQRGGDLAGKLTSDLEVVEQIWSHFIGGFVSGLAMPFFLTCLLLWVDWRLSLVLLAGLPLAGVALMFTHYITTKSGVRLVAANAISQSTLLEYIKGIAVVRSFGRFGMIWQRLDRALSEQFAASIAIEAKPTPWLAAYGFILEISYIALVLLGAWLLSAGSLTAENLLIFMILALPVHRQLFDVGLSTVLLRFASHALQRINTIIDESVMPEPEQSKNPQGSEIVFDRVHFSYDEAGESVTLADISCRLAANQLTALVGPSGAGKSTFVHLIARLWDVDKGAIRLGGVDVRDVGVAALHKHIAMVFQQVMLFSGTVRENLVVGNPNASMEEVIEAAKRAQAHAFIEALPQAYDTVLEEGGGSLSGGERQRLSIARALLKDAPILLLDEATASVDPSAEAEIQRAMSELIRNRTVVVIAHRLKNIRHADQILVLEKGRLVEQGTHETLIEQNGLYATMWQKQQIE